MVPIRDQTGSQYRSGQVWLRAAPVGSAKRPQNWETFKCPIKYVDTKGHYPEECTITRNGAFPVASLVRTDDLDKADLFKHAGAIHISGKLTVVQRKASNILLYNAFDELLHKDEHRIRIRDLAGLIGTTSHNLDHLKDALRGLATTPIEWNVLDASGRQQEWGVTTFLAHIRLRQGYCYYSYSTELKRKLHNPDVYAKINLEVQRKISGSHAFVIYENCLRFIKVGSTGWIPLLTFRKLLYLHENPYFDDFRKLNDKVIKPALEQLNDSSDVEIEVEFRRERRKVAALRFKVQRKIQLDLFEVPPTAEVPAPLLEDKGDLSDRLFSFGLTAHQVDAALNQYDEAYLRDKIAIAELAYQAGKVQHLGRFTYAAIRDDYRHGRSPKELEDEHAGKARQARKDRRKVLEETIAEIERGFASQRLKSGLEALGADQRAALQAVFVEALQQSKERGDGLVRDMYRRKGFESPVVQASFNLFVRGRLPQPDSGEAALKAYAAGLGYDLPALRAELAGLE